MESSPSYSSQEDPTETAVIGSVLQIFHTISIWKNLPFPKQGLLLLGTMLCMTPKAVGATEDKATTHAQ